VVYRDQVDSIGARRRLLELLVKSQFPGVRELRDQLGECDSSTIDANGSLRLTVARDLPAAAVLSRVPVEGVWLDGDGVRAHALLHVVDGRLHELEIFRDDSGHLRSSIDVDDVYVVAREVA
jgi:Domain of unknown function (DUF6984)